MRKQLDPRIRPRIVYKPYRKAYEARLIRRYLEKTAGKRQELADKMMVDDLMSNPRFMEALEQEVLASIRN